MNNTTAVVLTDIYDWNGAMAFIVVIICWYSVGVVLLMVTQMTRPTEIVEESERHSKKLFTQNLHEKSDKKIILEELTDKKKRDRLWDIYLGESGTLNNRATQADRLRVQHMERKLENLKEKNREERRSLQFSRISSAPDLLSVDGRLRDRRQLSSDQQILEQWQATMGAFRVNENWPWPIQKLFIQRHLRRQRK